MLKNLIVIVAIIWVLSEHILTTTIGYDLKKRVKRQLFREHLLPHRGGKVPDGAFNIERLAANRLSKAGISIPDGILLQQIPLTSESSDSGVASSSDLELKRDIVHMKQTPDGRFTAVGGHYPFWDEEIESTYVIYSPLGHPAFQQIIKEPLPAFWPSRSTSSSNVRSDEVASPLSHSAASAPSPLMSTEFVNSNSRAFTGGPSKNDNNDLHTIDTLYPELYYQSIGYNTETNRGYIPKFPSLTTLPITTFKCDSSGRIYPDPEANCQVFHICHADGRKESFLCPAGTRFEPVTHECNPWYRTQCIQRQ